MSGDARDFKNIETLAVMKYFVLQSKAPKEIHAILTKILAWFLPGRGKDLSAPLQYTKHMQGAEGNSRHSDKNIRLITFWSG